MKEAVVNVYSHAVLIDPFHRFVTDILLKTESDGSISCNTMYGIMDCQLVDVVQLSHLVDCWVDDEGLYRENQAYFKIDGRFLAGKAIILSSDLDGSSVEATVDATEVSQHVEWVDNEEGKVAASKLLIDGITITAWDETA